MSGDGKFVLSHVGEDLQGFLAPSLGAVLRSIPGPWSAWDGGGGMEQALGGGIAQARQACSSCRILLLKPLIVSQVVNVQCMCNTPTL